MAAQYMFHFAHSMNEKQVKVIFLGNDAVGKTSIIRRFAENIFRERYKPTLGVQVFTRENYEYPPGSGEKLLIYLWDIGAQQLYEIVRPDYYVGVSGVVYVGDLTEPDTIKAIERWASEVKTHVKYPCGWAVALNKFDVLQESGKTSEKKVLEEMGKLLPKEVRDPQKIFLTSAKNDYNVTELIQCVLSQIL